MTKSSKKFKLLSFPEGRVFALGLVVGMVFIVLLLISQRYYPEKSSQILAVTLTHMMFGRAAAMFLGLTIGLSLLPIIVINVFIDSLWVLFLYPLVILSIKQLLTVKLIKRHIDRVSSVANHYKEKIKQFGSLGLFLFVVCPLPMTGPIVGGVIGNLLGFRLLKTLMIIFMGCYTTILMWAIIFSSLHQKTAMLGTSTSIAIIIGIILISLGAKFVYEKSHGQNTLLER